MSNDIPPDDLGMLLGQGFDLNRQLEDAKKEHEQEMRSLLLSCLEVLDSFDRCLAAAKQTGSESAIAQNQLASFEGLRKQFQRALERAGVEFMDCTGQPFDPHQHEAVEIQSSPGVQEGIVLEEITRGCQWKGEILRLAKVTVSGNKD